MKRRGGYDIALRGRPSGNVEVLPEPAVLQLPLRSRRFTFSELRVEEGRRVHPGQTLAKDPGNYSIPLIAPRAGTVRLETLAGHIVLEDVAHEGEEVYDPPEEATHVAEGLGSSGMKRYRLLVLGAWQFLHDAHTGAVPDPFAAPRAVIVSTLAMEPFTTRGDVQLHKRLGSFIRGLEHFQSLLEYQPIYLVLPEVDSELAREVRETIRGYAWARLVQVPLRYPFDDFALLARSLGLSRDPDSPVWAVRADGVLAADRALTLSRPCTVRIVSVGGPAAKSPHHVKAIPGYPLEALLAGRVEGDAVRVLDGGVFTGEVAGGEQKGLGAECTGLTLLPEQTEREFLGFVRPGSDRRSYSRCFLSSLRGRFSERLTTGLRGERRPCVACGFCEEVCPARIMPHLIHKMLYQDELEEAELARVDLCVACGLCSFVCPSKIDLRKEFLDARVRIREELHAPVAEEVEA